MLSEKAFKEAREREQQKKVANEFGVKKTEKRKQLLEIIVIGISAVLGWELGNLLF